MNNSFDLIRQSLPPSGRASGLTVAPRDNEVASLFAERITADSDLPPLEPLFRMFDTPCFYRGELVADCGKAKSGKTTFLSLLMSAAIGARDHPFIERYLAGNTDSAPPLKVLWIDTEQSQQSTQEIIRERIIPMTAKADDSNLYAFNLRGLGYEVRKRLVEVALLHLKPDIAIIDGIKDLMTDINDAVQATLIMEQLMALAREVKCCIVCVLHQNKSEADRNMRGSIGTELTNKAFEVYQCEVVGDKQHSTVFKVTQTYSRKRKMDQQLFYQLNEQGIPEPCYDFQEQARDAKGRWKKADTEELTPDELRNMFVKAFENRTQRTYGELMAVALKKCGVVDANVYYDRIRRAEELGIVSKRVHPETGITWVELQENTLPF